LGWPKAEAEAWLLGLDGEWFPCHVTCHRGIWISDATKPLASGMSGSPAMTRDGAIGVFGISSSSGEGAVSHEGGPQPYLPFALPGWMLKKGGDQTLSFVEPAE
jgi:hypothetical protein